MTNKTLDSELENLQKQAIETQKKAIEADVLYKSSKRILNENLVQTYIFWRKANMQIGYLEECYKNNNIGFNSKNNKPNFNPLIKLVFNMPVSKRNTANHWANGITAIDEEFIKIIMELKI